MTPAQTVLRFFNAMTDRNWDAVMALVSNGIVYDNKQLATLRGSDKFDAFLSPWVKMNDEILVLIHTVLESGELVVIERTDRERHTGKPWRGTNAAGFFRVVDGLIVEWRDYYDLQISCPQNGMGYEDIVAHCAAIAAG